MVTRVNLLLTITFIALMKMQLLHTVCGNCHRSHASGVLRKGPRQTGKVNWSTKSGIRLQQTHNHSHGRFVVPIGTVCLSLRDIMFGTDDGIRLHMAVARKRPIDACRHHGR
uniref:Putative secreted protein n=1 Tax=Anopheles marajoara TaxID=58244 RepID=A0A2M4C835_9DIPT